MRAKTGSTRRKRHKKTLKTTKGFRLTKSRLYKRAKEAALRAGQYAYIGRKLRKRDFRKLWITRINATLSQYDLPYSRFIHQLKENNIKLNRKMLAQLAVGQPGTFEKIVKKVS